MVLNKQQLANAGADLANLAGLLNAGKIAKLQFTERALLSSGARTDGKRISSTSHTMWSDILNPEREVLAAGNVTESGFVDAYNRAVNGTLDLPLRKNADNGDGNGARTNQPANAGQAAAAAGTARAQREPVSPNVLDAAIAAGNKAMAEVPEDAHTIHLLLWDAMPEQVKQNHLTDVVHGTLTALYKTAPATVATVLANLPADTRQVLFNALDGAAGDTVQDNLSTATTNAYHLDHVKTYLDTWDRQVSDYAATYAPDDAGFDWEPSPEDLKRARQTQVRNIFKRLTGALREEIATAERNRPQPTGPQKVLFDTIMPQLERAAEAGVIDEAEFKLLWRSWGSKSPEEQHTFIADLNKRIEDANNAKQDQTPPQPRQRQRNA